MIFITPSGEDIKTKRQLDQYLKSNPGGPASSEFDWSTGTLSHTLCLWACVHSDEIVYNSLSRQLVILCPLKFIFQLDLLQVA